LSSHFVPANAASAMTQEWISAPLLAAAIAALGFVAKLLIDAGLEWRQSVRVREARLVHLQSLLLASKRVFDLQCEIRDPLCDEFVAKDPNLDGSPYDEILARGFLIADATQKMTHGLIRQYTISAMRPLNESMLDWLAADNYYKLGSRKASLKSLAMALRTLEAHLILWRAKYEFWIPDKPERALVYMADEREHGAGFPTGIEDLVERLTGGTLREPE